MKSWAWKSDKGPKRTKLYNNDNHKQNVEIMTESIHAVVT